MYTQLNISPLSKNLFMDHPIAWEESETKISYTNGHDEKTISIFHSITAYNLCIGIHNEHSIQTTHPVGPSTKFGYTFFANTGFAELSF